MADPQPIPPGTGPVPAADEEVRFKTRLKELYGIDEDPETFKSKRQKWTKAEEEIPQYQATLTAIINHYKQQEALAAAMAPPQAAPPVGPSPEDEEERLRTIMKLDPYEGTKRILAKRDEQWAGHLEQVQQAAAQQGERSTVYHQTLRRSKEIVDQNWPEANDPNSELFKMGYRIFHQEMAQSEQQDPRAFLIATERAAGRLGMPPKSRRGSSSRRESIAAQSVSRGRTRPPDESDEEPLTAAQQRVVEKMGVSEKVYREALKNRKASAKAAKDTE
jgi:hypothetical protein